MKVNTTIYLMILLSVGLISAQSGKDYCSRAKAFSNYNYNNTDYQGDWNIDVKYYKLDLTINDSQKFISGTVTIKAESRADNLTWFFFDLDNNMQVREVRFNSSIAEFDHKDNKIVVTANSEIFLNEKFTVEIDYAGNPASTGFGSFNFSEQNGSPLIWSLSQPDGASNWWPCKNTPSDKADSADIWITCLKTLTAVSNGKLMEVTDAGAKYHTFKWKSSYPIAQYLISLAVTNYSLYENYYIYNNGSDTLTLTHYNYPARLNEQRIEQLDETVNMLEVFSNIFGEYPFINEKYGHAEISWGGGMEHQTISSMGGFFTDIVAHELTHQWFGDKITCADWHNIWLNEGFATYGELIYKEVVVGTNEYDAAVLSEMNQARNASGSVYVEDISNVASIFNYSKSYAKGAVILHMLRGVLGDRVFFESLYRYANDESLSYSSATTEQFQQVVEDVSEVDLDYFFNQWIYGENYPVYIVSWSYKQSGELNINISQAANSNPQFFTMPMDIKVYTSQRDTLLRVFNDKPSQDITLMTNGVPDNVVIDPYNKILKEVVYMDENYIPSEFSVSNNYPNPFNSGTRIIYTLPGRSDLTISVFNSNGELIVSELLTNRPAGKQIYRLNMNELPGHISSGVYLYKVSSKFGTDSNKMIYLK